MQIVIDIPEYYYKAIKEIPVEQSTADMMIIRNGTPLPKGHGRLIDAKAYEQDIRKHYFDNSTVIRCTEIALSYAPTIIEADKAESDDKE
jgi:hypothetical protein